MRFTALFTSLAVACPSSNGFVPASSIQSAFSRANKPSMTVAPRRAGIDTLLVGLVGAAAGRKFMEDRDEMAMEEEAEREWKMERRRRSRGGGDGRRGEDYMVRDSELGVSRPYEREQMGYVDSEDDMDDMDDMDWGMEGQLRFQEEYGGGPRSNEWDTERPPPYQQGPRGRGGNEWDRRPSPQFNGDYRMGGAGDREYNYDGMGPYERGYLDGRMADNEQYMSRPSSITSGQGGGYGGMGQQDYGGYGGTGGMGQDYGGGYGEMGQGYGGNTGNGGQQYDQMTMPTRFQEENGSGMFGGGSQGVTRPTQFQQQGGGSNTRSSETGSSYGGMGSSNMRGSNMGSQGGMGGSGMGYGTMGGSGMGGYGAMGGSGMGGYGSMGNSGTRGSGMRDSAFGSRGSTQDPRRPTQFQREMERGDGRNSNQGTRSGAGTFNNIRENYKSPLRPTKFQEKIIGGRRESQFGQGGARAGGYSSHNGIGSPRNQYGLGSSRYGRESGGGLGSYQGRSMAGGRQFQYQSRGMDYGTMRPASYQQGPRNGASGMNQQNRQEDFRPRGGGGFGRPDRGPRQGGRVS